MGILSTGGLAGRAAPHENPAEIRESPVPRSSAAPPTPTESLPVNDRLPLCAPARGAFVACALFLLLLSGPYPGAAASATQQADRVAVGDEAVDFALQSIDGDTLRLADLRGEKTLVLIFFRGTW